ncbi:MAG TPA: nucleotidyl transferase AbiEii/AbiGii toxin family protein [Acidobacteriota bacterium]|nr:nucleotidyl transferase AbiEii/AbiGii toxin family protein [Acidobacteriota bacterium]
MNRRRPKNVIASIQARLRQKARSEGRPYEELCTYYAIERFLYRLSISPYAKIFILKGALMQLIWMPESPRPTRDIDFLGFVENDVEQVMTIISEICKTTHKETPRHMGDDDDDDNDDGNSGVSEEEDKKKIDDDDRDHADLADGITYNLESIRGERIIEHAEYHGIRVTFTAHLGQQRIPMRVDIGIGDEVTPSPQKASLPVLLDHPAPVLLGYSEESTVSEKFQAMVNLGELNSRMKDFYDIWLMARKRDFYGPTLSRAIQATFKNRNTALVSNPLALQASFADLPGKAELWGAFLRKSFGRDVKTEPRPSDDLKNIIAELRAFLSPVVEALLKGRVLERKWIAGKSWE